MEVEGGCAGNRGKPASWRPLSLGFFESGSSLILLPVAANMAFKSAGAMTDTPGSPTPAGGAMLSTT
jgi:hypothetical protein